MYTTMIKKLLLGSTTVAATLLLSTAQAAISLSGTRLVLPEKQQEASITVRNTGGTILVQSWLETNSGDAQAELPFAITPTLSRMPSNGQQVLRVLYAGGTTTLPQDRESVFWLNVQEIPQETAAENQLQIAIRQRIKMFFRPEGLPGAVDQAPSALQWSINTGDHPSTLQVHNPSAYHVSMASLGTVQGKELNSPGMLAPGETRQLHLSNLSASDSLRFSTINDYGGTEHYEVKLNGTTPNSAQRITAS